MGDKAAAFDRTNEIPRRLILPVFYRLQGGQPIEAGIDLNRRKPGGVVLELLLWLYALIRIIRPFLVAPSAGADENQFHFGRLYMHCLQNEASTNRNAQECE